MFFACVCVCKICRKLTQTQVSSINSNIVYTHTITQTIKPYFIIIPICAPALAASGCDVGYCDAAALGWLQSVHRMGFVGHLCAPCARSRHRCAGITMLGTDAERAHTQKTHNAPMQLKMLKLHRSTKTSKSRRDFVQEAHGTHSRTPKHAQTMREIESRAQTHTHRVNHPQ